MTPEIIIALGTAVAAVVAAVGTAIALVRRARRFGRWQPQTPPSNGHSWPQGVVAVVETLAVQVQEQAAELVVVHRRLDACEERERQRLMRDE